MYSDIYQVYIQDQLSLVAHNNDSLSPRKTSKRESKNEKHTDIKCNGRSQCHVYS